HVAVDQHGAGAAHLLQTVRVPHHRRGLLPLHRLGPALDRHERRDHVHLGLAVDLELLPARRGLRAVLALDLDAHRAHARLARSLRLGAPPRSAAPRSKSPCPRLRSLTWCAPPSFSPCRTSARAAGSATCPPARSRSWARWSPRRSARASS